MKRFLLLALTAGLLSPIAAKSEDIFLLRKYTNPFTDKRVCWGETRSNSNFILRHDGNLDVPLRLASYRYRIDNEPPSDFIEVKQNFDLYSTNYQEEEKSFGINAGYFINLRNHRLEGDQIRFEFKQKDVYTSEFSTFNISNIKSTLAELKYCPIPKSY